VASVAARTFFEGLAARADAANLAGLDHSYRFEIEGEGGWNVRIHSGTIDVTEGAADGADATIRTSSEVFERLVSGAQNPATAYMTGKVKVEGDLGAVMKLQRLFS
jgi:putative sterol carrier protein